MRDRGLKGNVKTDSTEVDEWADELFGVSYCEGFIGGVDSGEECNISDAEATLLNRPEFEQGRADGIAVWQAVYEAMKDDVVEM
jgi:hypothetical protein